MIMPDGDAPYVLGQQRKTLAELRAELDSARTEAAEPASASAVERWRASIVVGAGVAVAVVALLGLMAALTSATV
ncbi:hypothetical protein ASE16_00335 [Leifsonia sp. Root227]|nr:hypothetical protein ASE16_00335 [Leifsonia sp. Root227]